jgi:hypothetical protein
MIKVKFDSKELTRILNNVSGYSNGFLQGVEMSKASFNKILGEYTAESLGTYIDSKARMNSDSLHHVYEWGGVGDRGSRLFDFNVNATGSNISLTGKFRQSLSISENSNEPFSNKAEIMENGISIVIEPKKFDVLVFEDAGETVFTRKSIYIANPGGDAVAGSFGSVVDEFFSTYFTNSVLSPIMKDLQSLKEFSNNFSQGSKTGRSAGVASGKKYMKIKGADYL